MMKGLSVHVFDGGFRTRRRQNQRGLPPVLRNCSANRWIALLVFIFSLTACAQSSPRGLPKSIQWQEEVQLSDGRVIIVTFEQKTDASLRRELFQPDPVGLLSLTFSHPDTHERIYWETRWGFEPDKKGLSVINLDIVDGVPYLVTLPGRCIDYNKVGRPNPPYVIYKYHDRAWQQITINELPQAITKRNLVGGVTVGKLLTTVLDKHMLTLRDKQYWMNTGLSKYLIQILRVRMKSGLTKCSTMYYDGQGGWRGAFFFRSNSSLAECEKYCANRGIRNKYCPCNEFFKGKQ